MLNSETKVLSSPLLTTLVVTHHFVKRYQICSKFFNIKRREIGYSLAGFFLYAKCLNSHTIRRSSRTSISLTFRAIKLVLHTTSETSDGFYTARLRILFCSRRCFCHLRIPVKVSLDLNVKLL